MNLRAFFEPPPARTVAEAVALNRFGLGARPGEAIGDPRRWLLAQLDRFDPRPAAIASGMDTPCAPRTKDKTSPDQIVCGTVLARAFAARYEIARTSSTPFVERLVHFWSNHFAVASEGAGRGRVGIYEFAAIRPHVLGRFADLLLAAVRHPAMLFYLDQRKSVGPNSPRSRRRNTVENLAREILELHTLGVRSVYAQSDVVELALALTGWTVAIEPSEFEVGAFAFDPERHEPGPRRFLGRTFPAGGEEQARAMLELVATHPATAKHIATKLAVHFAGDTPPPQLVARLEKAFLDSGGDLRTVYAALVAAPEPWAEGRAKFKPPWEWLVSVGRAAGMAPVPVDTLADTVGELGQSPWNPRSPAGFDDIASSWAGSDALLRRVKLAEAIARRLPPDRDAGAMAESLFGPALSRSTRQVLAGTRDRAAALALLLVAPEFLYR